MLRDRLLSGRSTAAFTLQWHLTNECTGNCSHCYDRSDRQVLTPQKALSVLEELRRFCRSRRVTGRVSLTGGDPLLYPHFWELYRAVSAMRFTVSILGNPISLEEIRRLVSIRPPLYYQVSLEGLREHNDVVRGEGHFGRVMSFLADAKVAGMVTHIMLTLTRDNMDQVIPLGRILRRHTRRFTFNRLAQVGSGEQLQLPRPMEFERFLGQYLRAARSNPVLGFKDNLFNVIRQRDRRPLFGGCTGHGCGAAFNFVAVLPDGEVHACRKFPSLIGNIHHAGLDAIYDSEMAAAYRRGSKTCQACSLRKSCGGCAAVAFGQGLDPLEDRDPFCFKR